MHCKISLRDIENRTISNAKNVSWGEKSKCCNLNNYNEIIKLKIDNFKQVVLRICISLRMISTYLTAE